MIDVQHVHKSFVVPVKGKRTWKPAKVLDVRIPDAMRKKLRPRWRDKDSQNIQHSQIIRNKSVCLLAIHPQDSNYPLT